jgi:hypothetical protein
MHDIAVSIVPFTLRLIFFYFTDYCAEAVMTGINCPLEQKCISNMLRCDGSPDCGVRSVALDETNCTSTGQ